MGETVTLTKVYEELVAIDKSLVLILVVLGIWYILWVWRGR